MEFLNQFMRIMRLTIIIITMALMQVSATGLAQKVSLNLKNVPLEQVLIAVQKQTAYNFVYTEDVIGKANPVNIKVNNAELKDVLDMCFKNQPLNFSIEQKTIVIKEKETSFLDDIIARFQAIDVRGRVVDEKGEPLPGASVKVKGKSQVAITNGNGEFILQNVAEDVVLEISYVGYVMREVKAAKDMGMIGLELASGELQEVVVNKGYYSTSKILNTGSVGSIGTKEISSQPVGDPMMALEGRITGLSISQTSGIPGSGLNINIRGLNSLRVDANAPLFIVNGIPFNSASFAQLSNAAGFGNLSPFASISPSDIENIEVLKDADATAIYGSRGANGVVLITTKKGRMGKTAVGLNLYQGAGVVSNSLKMMNTEQFLEVRREAFKNDNRVPQVSDYDLNGNWKDNTRYTDWQDIMIGGTANVTDVRANISGGSEGTQFLFGTGYRRETMVYPGDFNSQIANGNLNINHKSQDGKFTFNTTANYSNNNLKLPQVDFMRYVFLQPNAPALYDGSGQLNWEGGFFENPFSYLERSSRTTTDNSNNSVAIGYEFKKGLKASVNLGYNSTKLNENTITPFTAFNPTSNNPSILRATSIGFNSVKSWIVEPQLNYTKAFRDHHLDALIGGTFQSTKQEGLIQNAQGFTSDALLENPASAATLSSNASYYKYRYNAVFARIGYDYMGKYVINLTGRRDGSSRFGSGRQFGNFGAIGAAWIFSEEDFFTNISFISLGKIRGSIGRTGNDQISDYNYLSTYSSDQGYQGIIGLAPTRLANPLYGWETIDKAEVALELRFFKDKLNLNAGFYRNRTKNQLVGFSLPDITGFSSIQANLPAIIQNKGFEVDLSSVNISSSKFKWTTGFNLTIPRNQLVSYPDLKASTYATTYAIGMPLSVKFLYRYKGIDQTTGLYTFDDINKDGSVTFSGDREAKFIGQRFYGGLNNNIDYKGFSFSFFFQFVKQTGFDFIGTTAPGRFLNTGSNMPVEFFDRWRQQDDQSKYQRYVSFSSTGSTAWTNYRQSTGVITDASFIRLKNVSLSYTLSANWLKAIKLENVKLYLNAQNLLTFTKFVGIDPEAQQYGAAPSLPTLRVITGGIQVTF